MNTIERLIAFVSGKFVKTVNHQTIFGSGNISGGGGGDAEWGSIGGTLSNQTDLNTALGDKLDKLTDTGEFVYTHDGSTQTSKGFIAGDTLLNSSAHIPSAHTTYKAIQDLINDTVQDLTHTWSSEKINSLLTATLDCQVVATMPASPTDNTLYLVGPQGTAPNIYYEKKLRVDGVTYDAGTTNIDLSGYYNKTQVDDKLDDKQDTLVSGTNIKTINNESLLGSGNINIAGSVKTMKLTNGKTDGSGFLKDSSLHAIKIPGVLIGCKILNPTSAMLTGGMLQWILQNSTASESNLWSVKLLSWDGTSYSNLTGLNAELYYV